MLLNGGWGTTGQGAVGTHQSRTLGQLKNKNRLVIMLTFAHIHGDLNVIYFFSASTAQLEFPLTCPSIELVPRSNYTKLLYYINQL